MPSVSGRLPNPLPRRQVLWRPAPITLWDGRVSPTPFSRPGRGLATPQRCALAAVGSDLDHGNDADSEGEEDRWRNYLRMLWGKKILEWAASPQEALEVMIELNNKYALDGREPNSYSGIFWVLGRYDRPWGPERPVFGKVRYMSSESMLRKVNAREYVRRYSP